MRAFQWIDSGASLYSWVLQCFVVYFTPLLGWGLVDAGLRLPDSLVGSAFAYAFVAAASVALALAAAAIAPNSLQEGKWVWVLPAILELAAMIDQIGHFGASSVRWLFFMSDAGWLIFLLLTLPAWGCGVYSWVVWLRARRLRTALAGGEEI